MPFRCGKLSRTERSALPLPRPIFWAVTSVLMFLSLLAALWWIDQRQGHEPWTSRRGPDGLHLLTNLWNWVAGIFDGAAEVVTRKDGAPLDLRLACLALLILFFLGLRKTLLARTAHKPGPVDVQELVDATPGGEHNQLMKDLTAQFRKRLSETDLYPPSELPVEAPAESFLDLLGEVDPGKIGSSLLHLFSRLRPKVAYRVGGVLQKRDRQPSYGMTVTVTSFATRGSQTETLWEGSWEEVVHKAGYWVMATILPVTRASRKPPWQNWRGRNLPPKLFAAYQEGRNLSRERKLDEALENFYIALDIDPANVYLRTQIAATQEKMGLHLDALDTYHGALTLGRFSTTQENKYLWLNRYFWWSRIRHIWNWRHQRGFLQARYRYAVVLGTSEETAWQWCKEDANDHPQRAAAREEIRKTLAPALAERYWPTLIPPRYRSGSDSKAGDAERQLKDLLGKPKESNKPEIQLVFQLACLQEMSRLCQDYHFARLLGATLSDVPITWRARRINRYIWAPLRLAWVMDECWRAGLQVPPWAKALGVEPAQRPTVGVEPLVVNSWFPTVGMRDFTRDLWQALTDLRDERRELWQVVTRDWKRLRMTKIGRLIVDLGKAIAADNWAERRAAVAKDARYLFGTHWPSRVMAWPPDLQERDLQNRVKTARSRLFWEHHKDWQDHYNAACVYSVAMNGKPEEEQSRFEDLAITELENAVRGAESGFVTVKKSWLLAEDPDLHALRREDRKSNKFTRFEREVYPQAAPGHSRSQDVPVEIEMTAYDRDLLVDLALVMERTWHAREAKESATIHDVLYWLEGEAGVWEQLCTVAGDQARSWFDRARLLNKVKVVADRDVLIKTDVHTRVPECDEVLRGDTQPDGNRVRALDEDLAHVAMRITPRSAYSPINRTSQWVDKVRGADAQGWGPLSPTTRRILCVRYAGAWQRLHDLLRSGDPRNQERLRRAFLQALSDVPDPGMLVPM